MLIYTNQALPADGKIQSIVRIRESAQPFIFESEVNGPRLNINYNMDCFRFLSFSV
jgi:hypothetical protein